MKALLKRAVSRFYRRSSRVVRQGEFVTFTPEGFAAAKDPVALMCRHYYEVKALKESLARLHELGVTPSQSLEIGCGFGRLSPYIAEFSDQHFAVDINDWALSKARQCYPRLCFQQASVTDLPFPDRSFDVIVTWTVLQHIPNHLINKALAEIIRVAKPKSIIVLCEATLYATAPQSDDQHTHDRLPEFYAEALSPRRLIFSEFITELDQIPGLASPGRIMLFGPSENS